MASSINITNIDVTFPIAGQDNDSQGFRDNFFNTNDNFEFAKAEIEALQDNVVLKGSLTPGGTVDNDFGGEIIHNAVIENFRGTVVNSGVMAASHQINVELGPYHKVITGEPTTLSFIGFPTSGEHGVVQVEIDVTDLANTLTLPAPTVGLDGLQTAVGQVVTFLSTGTHILEFASTDGGTTIAVNDLTTDLSSVGIETTTSYGTSGTIALDMAVGTFFTPTGATTGAITFTFDNPAAAGTVTAFTMILNDAGTNAPTWPGSVTWPAATEPTWSAGGIDIVSFITTDNGTTWYGMLGGLAFA